MLCKYLENINEHPPTHEYIKATFNWWFQIKDNKQEEIDFKDEKTGLELQKKLHSMFAPMNGNGLKTRIVNNPEDLFK